MKSRIISIFTALSILMCVLDIQVMGAEANVTAQTNLDNAFIYVRHPLGYMVANDYVLEAFKNDFYAAASEGKAGLYDFENPPSELLSSPATINTLNVKFGLSNEKTLPLTRERKWLASAGYNHPSGTPDGLIPSSGDWSSYIHSSGDMITFGNIQGGEEEEYVTAMGFILVSRSRSSESGYAKIIATLNDNKTMVAGTYVGAGTTTGNPVADNQNVFLGIKAPIGKHIIKIQISVDHWFGLDDFGFITGGVSCETDGMLRGTYSVNSDYSRSSFEADMESHPHDYKGVFDFENPNDYLMTEDGFSYKYAANKTVYFTTSWNCDVYEGFTDRTPTSGTRALNIGTAPADSDWNKTSLSAKDNTITMSAQEPILAAGIHLLLRDKLPRYGYRRIKAFAVYDDGLKEEFSYRVYEGNGKALFFSWKAPQGKAITSVTINMSGCSSIDDIWIMTGNEIAQSTPKNMYECFERATDFAEAMLEFGTDTYGSKTGGVFLSMLDREREAAFDRYEVMKLHYGNGKIMPITLTPNKWNINNSTNDVNAGTPSSGNNYLNFSLAKHNFSFDGALNAPSGERVTAAGIVAVSKTTTNGWAYVTAYYSDGTSQTVSHKVHKAISLENDYNVFFGFKAPIGEYITDISVEFDFWGTIDDLGFITEYIPDTPPPQAYAYGFETFADTESVTYQKVKYSATEYSRDDFVRDMASAAADNKGVLSFEYYDEAVILDGMPPAPYGVRIQDRVNRSGANPLLDTHLYSMMYELSQITGDDKYAQAADDAYAFFLENAQSPVTWLLGWGENLYWDTRADKVDAQDDFFHEPFSSEKCPDIGRLFDLNPQVCYQYALGMWRNQIHNHETGNFSRHANWDVRNTGQYTEFPGAAGYFIEWWAHGYARTGDEELLGAIDVLLRRYENSMARYINDFNIKAIEGFDERRYGTAPEDLQHYIMVVASIAFATSLDKISSIVPPSYKERIEDLTRKIDEGFLELPHFPEDDPELGFVRNCRVSAATREFNYIDLCHIWGAERSKTTISRFAVGYLINRYNLLEDGIIKEQYKQLILKAAKIYLSFEPDETVDYWAIELADAIELLAKAYEITGEYKYLIKADWYAGKAIENFLGDKRLPKASNFISHYETVTGAHKILNALVALYRQYPQIGARLYEGGRAVSQLDGFEGSVIASMFYTRKEDSPPQTPLLALAKYDSNMQLKDLKILPSFDIEYGKNIVLKTPAINVGIGDTGGKLKIFIWQDENALSPIKEAEIIDIK